MSGALSYGGPELGLFAPLIGEMRKTFPQRCRVVPRVAHGREHELSVTHDVDNQGRRRRADDSEGRLKLSRGLHRRGRCDHWFGDGHGDFLLLFVRSLVGSWPLEGCLLKTAENF